MIAKTDDTGRYLLLNYENDLEYDQISTSFTKRIRNAKFRAKGRWNGDVNFIKDRVKLPIGLWRELKTLCDRFKFPLKFAKANEIFDLGIDKKEIEAFCYKLMEHNPKFTPRPEQIEAVYRSLKYRHCMMNLSVAAGKTLIQYMSIMYLIYKKKINRAMIVCPDADLVIQMYANFKEFGADKFPLKSMCMVHGGSVIHDISEYKIVIGNFQSFNNRPVEFFYGVQYLAIDECHRAGSDSMKYIFDSTIDAKYRVGLSGSIVVDTSADYFTLLAYLGPVVMTIKKLEIIDKGYATDIKITIIRLNYLKVEERRKLALLRGNPEFDGEKIYRYEQNLVRDSRVRINWLCEFIIRLRGNSIIFFLDKKNEYGKRIMQTIQKLDQTKEVYYIDGEVTKSLRAAYKARMEESNNRILVASYSTYSTGKSINNIHNIVTAESYKSEVVINQTMGRGMRLHETKEVYNWWDIVDDFSISEENYDNRNILLRHMDNRIRYYNSEGFKYTAKQVDLMNTSENLLL